MSSEEESAPLVVVESPVTSTEVVEVPVTVSPIEKIVEKKRVDNTFSIPIIIAAALIFIVIIAWFESLRVWLEFAFNTSTVGLFNKALADMVYAICATVIVILLIFLILKFWLKTI